MMHTNSYITNLYYLQYKLLVEKINSNKFGDKFQIATSQIGMLPQLRKQFVIKHEEILSNWLFKYKVQQEAQMNCSTSNE